MRCGRTRSTHSPGPGTFQQCGESGTVERSRIPVGIAEDFIDCELCKMTVADQRFAVRREKCVGSNVEWESKLRSYTRVKVGCRFVE
jgi:hypothetical protein